MARKTASKRQSSQIHAQALIDFLDKQGRAISPLLILTHNYPDPDALASAYALQYLAEQRCGIHSRIVFGGAIGRIENQNMVKFLDLPVHRVKPREIHKYAHVALVDTQPSFENNAFPNDRMATLVIDQHPSNSEIRSSADLLLVDSTCGATCVILAQAILMLELPVPERLATALAYGIISDTLNLYRAARRDIIKTYLAVLSCANMRTLARIQTPLYGKDHFAMLQRGIQNARLSQGMILCHLGKVTSPDAVSQIAEFLLSYQSAKWVLSTGRYRNKLHLSLRTATMEFPAAPLLRACVSSPENAGGHGHIAGGAVSISPRTEEQFNAAEERLEERLRQQLALRKPRRYSRLCT